jgi:hypothetical protein
MNITKNETITETTTFDYEGHSIRVVKTTSEGRVNLRIIYQDRINHSSIYFNDQEEVRLIAEAMLEAVK